LRRVAIYWTAFALVVGVAYGAVTVVRRVCGLDAAAIVYVERPQPLPNAGPPLESFELTNTQGKPFSSAELRGKVWLGSFFFTNCPSACRKLNQAISSVQQRYPELQFVSITCDPANDTPEVLAKYAELFQADPARWHFLTGPIDYILRIGKDLFKVTVVPGDHSTRAVLVGRNGQIVGHFQMLDPGDLERLAEAIPKPSPRLSPLSLRERGRG
jgi:cytochrome oxidase Cu insertion factor (SCO1/SenC/PrrC family)